MKEYEKKVLPGSIMLIISLALLAISAAGFIVGITQQILSTTLASIIAFLIWIVYICGFFTLQPNEAAAMILFGDYKGTVKCSGWHWANPFFLKKKISLRSRNLNGDRLKVNDEMGNPIEIAAVVVWRVQNTAEALFDVDNYIDYVKIQSESALRHLAGMYPYDITDDAQQISLRGSADEVSEALKIELQERLGKAGVVIEEARLSQSGGTGHRVLCKWHLIN